MRVFIPRFLGAIGYLLVLTVVGTVGYVSIEGWPWREGLSARDLNAVQKQIDQTREFVFNPAADTRLDIGDEMVVLGQPDQVSRLRGLTRA